VNRKKDCKIMLLSSLMPHTFRPTKTQPLDTQKTPTTVYQLQNVGVEEVSTPNRTTVATPKNPKKPPTFLLVRHPIDLQLFHLALATEIEVP